jgi:hypothetical protein
MQRYFCDSCGKELQAKTDCRYEVRIEVRAIAEAVEMTNETLSGQDDPDHIDAMEELLATADDDTELELRPTEIAPGACRYDLCSACYPRFQADPLGLNRGRKVQFSEN